MEEAIEKRKKKYEHIPIRPSTFISFRALKSKLENKVGKKISDNDFVIRLLGEYHGL